MVKKICLLGDAAVGKTSLVKRYVHDIFDDSYIATIGTKITKKDLFIRKPDQNISYHIKFTIWDVLGQHTFTAVKATAYKGTTGALLVCDITRPETLAHTKNWAKTLTKEVGDIPLILLVNKCDLDEERKITEKGINTVAQELGVNYCYTSAKTGDNAALAFRILAQALIEEHSRKAPVSTPKPVKVRKIKPSGTTILDEMIDDFCDTHGGQEEAMPIIRRKIDEIDMDFFNPTAGKLKKLLWTLTDPKDGFYSHDEGTKMRDRYMELIDQI
jgi:small GTP-binding protein